MMCSFLNRFSILSLSLAVVLLAHPGLLCPVRAADKDALEDSILKGVDDDLKASPGKGRFAFALDGTDGKPIDAARFVRGIPGQFSVSEFPRGFSIEGHPLFQAGRKLDSTVGQKGVAIFCDAPAGADGEAARYVGRCSANLPGGKYTIDPFGLTFDVGQALQSAHPALSVTGNTIHIRTMPVTFRAVDAKSGASVPLVGVKLLCGKADLLAELLEAGEAGGFNPLTLYLPVGVSYQSSFGDFAIDADGTIRPSPAAAGFFDKGAFVLRVERTLLTPTTNPVAVGEGYWLASQNLRRVYRRGEVAPFVIIASGKLAAAKLPVIAKDQSAQHPLGDIQMPAVDGMDSRLFLLDTAALAPGKYELTLKGAKAHPFAIEVVDLLQTTPLLLFTLNACGESDFTTDSAGLDQLRAAGVRCWTSYGFGGGLNATGVGQIPYPPAPADAPPELRRPVSNARAVLDDSLRHGLTTIDFEARRLNWYNEGLAFHHSEPMTVDRMVRRVQIFGQELGDYPAFAGLSYTWFPQLGGYTEGGVATDPFFATRMVILHNKVKDQTGAVAFTPEQQKEWEKTIKTEAGVRQALADARRKFWRAEQHAGWYETFELYNRKLKEVRPDFIATTSCNAGHDGGARVADMAGAHDAMTWESYTDFGDWPMSAGFCADWAHGMAPGKPQWQQVDSAQSEPAIVAKQLWKLARGIEGIGVGVHGVSGARSNARRAKSNHFLERYGSLITGYEPDNSVAVCVNQLSDQAEYQAHALYSHLTRLGYGPVILSEETIEKGVPAGVKVVFIPNLHVPFSMDFQKSLSTFNAGGGKVVEVGEHCLPIDGAVRVEVPLKNLWDIGGFAAHLAFWEEFKKVRPALEKVMSNLAIAPPNGSSPEKAIILPIRSAGVSYVAVISSPLDAKDTEFKPVQGIVVKAKNATVVVNLITGKMLPVVNGSVNVDLISEPAALLALLDAPPSSIALRCPALVTAGQSININCEVKSATNTLNVPVQLTIRDSGGKERASFYRLSGSNRGVIYDIPATEPGGAFTVEATELLTGLSAKASVKIAAVTTVKAVIETDPVFLPHADRIPSFLARTGEVRIIVEETQPQVLADAEKLAKALREFGRSAGVQKVSPGNFDSLKLRWYPTKHDQDVLAKIDTGELIGYRIDLKPYINAATRQHVPEKGGWADIEPKYVIRNDVIVFSGGAIAKSLRAVTDWTETPAVPGIGQGAIEVALSPFWADRQAVAIISNDDAGRTHSVDRLIELIESHGKGAVVATVKTPSPAADLVETVGATRAQLETPLKGFIPPALAVSIESSNDGYAIVQTASASQIVSADGKIVQLLPASAIPPMIAEGGVYFGAAMAVTRSDAAWNFPTAWKLSPRIADARGRRETFDLPAEVDWIGDHYRGWDGEYAVSPDGKTYFAGQAGGGFVLYGLPGKTYRNFPYDPKEISYCETARVPRFITSSRFSPDGKFVAFSMAHHPSGYGGLGSPPISPFATSICVMRVSTGDIVWRHEATTLRDGSFSSYANTLAVSEGASRVAIIDWNQEAVIFDATGKELFRKPVFDWKQRYGASDGRTNRAAIRTEIARDGSVTMFATGDTILLTDGTGASQANIPLSAMCDARLSIDGSRVFAADMDGGVSCFDRTGLRLWSIATEGDNPKLAVNSQGLLVAEGTGNLLLISADGKELRRTPLVTPTSATPADGNWTAMLMNGPAVYREPTTLATLQKYGAKQVARWEPSGTGLAAFGRTFYPLDRESKPTLSANGREMHVVHVVYRRHANAGGEAASVLVASGGKSRTFILDLPTPEYRVVDLPCEEKQDVTVTINPDAGFELAEMSIHTMPLPGTNVIFVKPAGLALDHVAGLEVTGDKPDKPSDADILDDKDASQVGKAAAGKMKNALIFSRNPDPDQVEGHYLRATGNPLDNLDGRKFADGKPSAWTRGELGPWGSTLVVDLNHHARPKLCLTYERTLRQSEVMRAVVALRAGKDDMDAAKGGPDQLAIERRGIGGVLDNDQFFNAFDIDGVEMDALGLFVHSGRGRDHGLSEIELFE